MDICVIPDIIQGQINDISFEMLGLARKLAREADGTVYTVLLGDDVDPFIPAFGASDVVIKVVHEDLAAYNPERYQLALLHVLRTYEPDVVLLGHTTIGMDLGGFLAAKLGKPLLAFCTQLAFDEDGLVAKAQICGGKALATCKLADHQGVVLLTCGMYHVEDGQAEGMPSVEEVPYTPVETAVQFERFLEPEADDLDITKEEVLVGVGRGLQDQEYVPLAEELADTLGAALCASRPVIEQGWLPLTRQVGRSGKIVKPKLYVALGISGAPEHVEGMKEADLIIAVNTDPDAPIFQVADYGIVGDALEVVPLLTEAVQKQKGG